MNQAERINALIARGFGGDHSRFRRGAQAASGGFPGWRG